MRTIIAPAVANGVLFTDNSEPVHYRSDHELLLFGWYVEYMMAVARYLLPGIDWFDGIPLNQELLLHQGPNDATYQRVLGAVEYGAYYVVRDRFC